MWSKLALFCVNVTDIIWAIPILWAIPYKSLLNFISSQNNFHSNGKNDVPMLTFSQDFLVLLRLRTLNHYLTSSHEINFHYIPFTTTVMQKIFLPQLSHKNRNDHYRTMAWNASNPHCHDHDLIETIINLAHLFVCLFRCALHLRFFSFVHLIHFYLASQTMV